MLLASDGATEFADATSIELSMGGVGTPAPSVGGEDCTIDDAGEVPAKNLGVVAVSSASEDCVDADPGDVVV